MVLLPFLLLRERVQRHRVFRPSAGEARPEPPQGIPPVEQWTDTFSRLEGKELVTLLDRIEVQHRDLYQKWSLGYLHARALVDAGEAGDALPRLQPYLAKGHALRDRALYHRASIAEGKEASRWRTTLIDEHPDSMYRDEAIDEELDAIAALGEPAPLLAFADKLAPSASTARRRELSARIVEALVEENQLGEARTRGLALLKGGIGDDAADRVVRALDRPEIVRTLDATQLETFGEAFGRHRHYDRAVALLTAALAKSPPARRDDLTFAIGRAHFGAEEYEQAQQIYLRGAAQTADAGQKTQFFWHAARAAQLRNDDATAEKLMTNAIAVRGKFPATTVALTQRIRTRVRQRRLGEAASDLALLKRMAPNDRAVLDASLAYAVGVLGAGNSAAALSVLNAIPNNLLDEYDKAEVAYWRARALEQRDPPAAFRAYLEVLRADAPTHFAYFARTRLDSAALAAKVEQELAKREAQVATLLAAKDYEAARAQQTDRILLSSKNRQAELEKLRSIYRELPAYRAVLELEPHPLPRFPDVDASDPQALLMAMGLHDEAVEAIEGRFALRPAREGLTRAHALNLGAASKASIYAVEVLMKSVPSDFHPDLLPPRVRQLLYPRYFYDAIAEDADRYDADPALVLSIMREESRFDPRAKSQAAARGLLQFIITTARDIGRDIGIVDVDPEDLYDPRIIIRLGAKYIGELTETFDGNRYRAAAAYNAGPKQVALWSRLQAADGDDYFLTAVNFDETKHYVRKVMNSYERYRAIYEDAKPVGGLRVEP
jgi:soluble lytic murein transglycosylase-like protein/tetratricopeptide (TPR) repeat protein